MKKKDKATNPAEPVNGQTTPEDGFQEPQFEGEAEQPREAPEATAQEWQAALELAVKQRDELKDSLLRAQADFQNFKRRNNLERAIDAAEKADDEAAKALADGVKMTLNTLMESLKRFGFEEVPALGEEFDPEKHNAVMREVAEDPGKVLEVFQKGYKVKDKIIRYAMVKVAVEE